MKTPMALVLDDDPERRRAFLTKLSDHEVRLAKTASSAIRALDETRFDVAYLDHDLDREGPNAGTGMDVVRHIAEMPARLRPKEVNVHSHNASKRALMVRLLRAAGVAAYSRPFRS